MTIFSRNAKLLILVVILVIAASYAHAFKAKDVKNAIETKEFYGENLYTSQTNLPLKLVAKQIPNSQLWNEFLAKNPEAVIYIDPRSGRPTSLIASIPFIPGTGTHNSLTLTDISNKLGRKIERIGDAVIKDLTKKFLQSYASLLYINADEIGNIRAGKANKDVWHIYIQRAVNGIPVRKSFINIAVNHGNIVMLGVHKWGDVKTNLIPSVSMEQAISNAFNYISINPESINFIKRPHLELVPYNPKSWNGSIENGYDYLLTWAFSFKIERLRNTWEFLVDAHNGKVISFVDINKYSQKKIVGSIYPVSNDECGVDGSATESPMPYTDTGFLSPNDYTNMGGIYDYTTGTATTYLDGKYTSIADECGDIIENSDTGDIDLSGTNGEHDCTVPAGHSAGDTFAARSGAAELTFINRTAAGWVNYSWLNQKLTAYMNIDNTCNAFWDGSTVNFYRSGGGCGNTGEIAAVFDHEWGHGIDYNDANGPYQNPGEVLADVVANLRLHNSCTGRGFLVSLDAGCSQWTCPSNPSITGYNCDGYGDCCTDCTGVRDQDYAKHISGTPHTPANFICVYCSSGSGPCGMEEHCENAPAAEAVWDLAARDLQSAPFNLDKNTAFEIAQRLTYVGEGSIVNWYACNCSGGTSDGCASDSGYMNYLNADDDDGDLNNGTPHMTAIYDAFNRHGIACSLPTPTNSGCSTGPTDAPTLTGTPSNNSITLNWTAVTNANQYYVYRTESPMGCDFGKILIATTSNTSYTDDEVLNWKDYYYTVQAVGSNNACLGPQSNCINITPVPGPHASYYSDIILDYCNGVPGDGIIDPGETINTAVTIQNDGIGDLSGIAGTLSTSTPSVSITDADATFPDITNGNTGTSDPPHFAYQVSDSFTCGEKIFFDLNLTFNEGSNITNFSHQVGQLGAPQVIFFEDWESGSTDWTMSGLWHLTTESAQNCMQEPYPSSVTVAYYGQDSTCNYNTGATTSGNLDRTAAISGIASNSNLTFMFVNGNEGSSSYDISYVYVSPDGTTWTQVWQWAGTQQTTWAQAGPISLASWAGQSIYLRFRFDSVDGYYNNYLGWAVDNIQISASSWECTPCAIPYPYLQPYLNQKPIVNDAGSPTANGIIEPDENIQLIGTLENTGTSPATNVTGTLSTLSPITITDPNAAYPDIASGDHQTCTDCYTIIAPSTNRPNTHWDFTVQEDSYSTGYGPWSYGYTYHAGNSFSDVPTSNPFYAFIETLLHSGITSGCTATTYCPLNNVQRQAMAKFICLAMENSSPGACTSTSCTPIFTDVPASNPFCPFIEALYTAGIVTGCNTDPLMYCPTNNVNRQQMAKFICLAMEAANPGSCSTATCNNWFGDVPASNPFCTFIEALYSAGVVNGCNTDPLMYCPTNNVNRQQMAKFIVNAFGFTL